MLKKNILWINHFLPYPPRGGVLIRTNTLLKEVAKDHNVTLICLIQPRLVAPYFDSVDDGVVQIKQWCKEHNIMVHTFQMPAEKSKTSRYLTAFKALFSFKPYSVKWLTSSKMRQYLSEQLQSDFFDAVHIDTMGLLDNVDEKLLSASVIVNHHNAEHIMMARRASKEKNLLKRLYYGLESKKIEAYDKRKLQFFKNHIACSEPDAKKIKQLGKDLSVSLVPNGVTIKTDVTRSPVAGNFLFVGGLDWYPNTDAIIFLLEDIAPKLSNKEHKIQIDIVGKNPNNRIIELVSKFEFIKLHGYVDDIAAMYANAQAFLCPLRDGGGTKLKVLDAMMHGLPVIGTDIAFEGIDVENGKQGFVCNQSHEITSLVLEMAGCVDNREYENVGQSARELVQKKYNATAIAHNYSQRLNQL